MEAVFTCLIAECLADDPPSCMRCSHSRAVLCRNTANDLVPFGAGLTFPPWGAPALRNETQTYVEPQSIPRSCLIELQAFTKPPPIVTRYLGCDTAQPCYAGISLLHDGSPAAVRLLAPNPRAPHPARDAAPAGASPGRPVGAQKNEPGDDGDRAPVQASGRGAVLLDVKGMRQPVLRQDFRSEESSCRCSTCVRRRLIARARRVGE
jgi:hypothetical protein